MKMNLENIKSLNLTDMPYEYFGIRADNYVYSIGDTTNNSHQLFQDPMWNEDDELVYPEGEGIYSGFYDAGELDGTCSIGFDPEDENSIERALQIISDYFYDSLYIIAGNYAESGNDIGEIIIRDAVVVAVDAEDMAKVA